MNRNLTWQSGNINKQQRAKILNQKPYCIWLTGLSGAGKSTIANALETQLHSTGKHTYILDGDNIRHGLNNDLDFTISSRIENIRRVAQVARLMVDAGLIVIVASISPFRSEREMVRNLFETDEFIEVFINTPLAICQQRDPKGLYQKAKLGQLTQFTGIDSPYEAPLTPEIEIDTSLDNLERCLMKIINKLPNS